MDYYEELTHVLGQQIERRFSRVSNIGGIDIGLVENEEGIYWRYKGVECHVSFYKNSGGINNLFFNLKFQKKQGLAEKVDASITAGKIDESKYFGKVSREHLIEGDADSYIVRCHIKKMPKTRKQRDDMLGYIWGNLIGPSLGKAAELS